jgi:CheY-like chemotaxis protein
LTESAYDLAVLDISVGQGTSFDFAGRLRRQGVPYIFASGYGDQVALDVEHSGAMVVQKPYDREALRQAVQQMKIGVARSRAPSI